LCGLSGDRWNGYPKNDGQIGALVSSSILSNIDSVVAGRNLRTMAAFVPVLRPPDRLATPQDRRTAGCGCRGATPDRRRAWALKD